MCEIIYGGLLAMVGVLSTVTACPAQKVRLFSATTRTFTKVFFFQDADVGNTTDVKETIRERCELALCIFPPTTRTFMKAVDQHSITAVRSFMCESALNKREEIKRTIRLSTELQEIPAAVRITSSLRYKCNLSVDVPTSSESV